MTEKHYGGTVPYGAKENTSAQTSQKTKSSVLTQKTKDSFLKTKSDPNTETLKKAGEIAKEVKTYARQIAKKDALLLDIANQIEEKIIRLGGKPAFPVNLSINEIAAHATPSFNDAEKAHGLLKIDIGVHVDGFVADTALTIDLENSNENALLIEAANSALNSALSIAKPGCTLRQIGAEIENAIKRNGFQPIINLSGHSIEQYNLHSGITIPNYDNHQNIELPEGVYAIEPFVTTGHGRVRDGRPSGIYHLENDLPVRDPFAREVLAYIDEEYSTLPFCSRWLVRKFGSRALLALKRLEDAHILHHYSQLIEIDRKPVAQAEHTLILTNKEAIITT